MVAAGVGPDRPVMEVQAHGSAPQAFLWLPFRPLFCGRAVMWLAGRCHGDDSLLNSDCRLVEACRVGLRAHVGFLSRILLFSYDEALPLHDDANEVQIQPYSIQTMRVTNEYIKNNNIH